MCVCVCVCAQLCPTLFDLMDCSLTGSSVHGKFSGKNTGMDCYFLLQGIFLTQGSNPSLLHLRHCRWIFYHCATWETLRKYSAAAAAKSFQSCPTLCDPIDVSPPGSPIPGILQARTLEWVAISFSNA